LPLPFEKNWKKIDLAKKTLYYLYFLFKNFDEFCAKKIREVYLKTENKFMNTGIKRKILNKKIVNNNFNNNKSISNDYSNGDYFLKNSLNTKYIIKLLKNRYFHDFLYFEKKWNVNNTFLIFNDYFDFKNIFQKKEKNNAILIYEKFNLYSIKIIEKFFDKFFGNFENNFENIDDLFININKKNIKKLNIKKKNNILISNKNNNNNDLKSKKLIKKIKNQKIYEDKFENKFAIMAIKFSDFVEDILFEFSSNFKINDEKIVQSFFVDDDNNEENKFFSKNFKNSSGFNINKKTENNINENPNKFQLSVFSLFIFIQNFKNV
jgi:hypothetical protein